MDTNKIFSLYPCCVIVDGNRRSAIYDLQREMYKLVPNTLYMLLKNYKDYSIKEIIEKFPEQRDVILSYYNFLIDNDWGILQEKSCNIFVPIQTKYELPNLITNAIIDYERRSSFSLSDAISKIDKLHCENLEIRLYDVFSIDFIQNEIFVALKNTSVRDLELMVQYDEMLSFDNILKLFGSNQRLKRIVVSSCPQKVEKIYSYGIATIIFTSEIIKSEACCGVVNPWYFIPKTELYLESLHFNTCLNSKISVDRFGNIKNCPSMEKIWGNINEDSLYDIANNKQFQNVWTIKKDDIETCKDCEFRYMCQDCRAYTDDFYSKPLKCNYNPYTI